MPSPIGLYLKMNLSMTGRDRYSWNLSKRAYGTYLNSGLEEGSANFYSGSYKEENTPIEVKEVPCLFTQIEALYLLFQDKKPDLWLMQGTVAVEVLYIFGDKSGSGFGDYCTEEDAVSFRFGVWDEKGDGTSSNYQ